LSISELESYLKKMNLKYAFGKINLKYAFEK
jgi:hypothetical protein